MCSRIRLLPWRQKNKAIPKAAQIKFQLNLRIAREGGWAHHELLIVNRSRWMMWVQRVAVALIYLGAKWQAVVSTEHPGYEILQKVRPSEELSMSFAWKIYDAAGSCGHLTCALSLRMSAFTPSMRGAM